MIKVSIIPWTDCIITIDPPEESTEQGIVLSQELDSKQKPDKGIVVAIGKSGESKMVGIEVGDTVFYERYTKNETTDEGKIYNFVRAKHIMGYKKKEKEFVGGSDGKADMIIK